MSTLPLDFAVALFVPGDRPGRFRKTTAAGAEAFVIDVDDMIEADAKDDASALLQGGLTAFGLACLLASALADIVP